jgi:hypothetical protein
MASSSCLVSLMALFTGGGHLRALMYLQATLTPAFCCTHVNTPSRAASQPCPADGRNNETGMSVQEDDAPCYAQTAALPETFAGIAAGLRG